MQLAKTASREYKSFFKKKNKPKKGNGGVRREEAGMCGERERQTERLQI